MRSSRMLAARTIVARKSRIYGSILPSTVSNQTYGLQQHPSFCDTSQTFQQGQSQFARYQVRHFVSSNTVDSNRTDQQQLEEEFDDDDDRLGNDEDDANNKIPKLLRFSKRNDKNSLNKRIWLDPKSPLLERVNRILKHPVGALHPLDVTRASVSLIAECADQKSLKGMKYAHDILDRLLEEKYYVNSKILQQAAAGKEEDDDDNNEDDDDLNPFPTRPTIPIVLPKRAFSALVRGWITFASDPESGPKRMREVIRLFESEAENDENIAKSLSSQVCRDSQVSLNDGQDIYITTQFKPDVDVYNLLLVGLVRTSERSIKAAIEAEGVLNHMIKMNKLHGWHTMPNTRSYTLAISAYGKTNHESAGRRAEDLLRRMISVQDEAKKELLEQKGVEYDPHLSRTKIVSPDTVTYTAVVNAHARSGSDDGPDRAAALLAEIIQANDPSAQPDATLFATVIRAFGGRVMKRKPVSERIALAERSEQILSQFIDEAKKEKELEKSKRNSKVASGDDEQNGLQTGEEDGDIDDSDVDGGARLIGDFRPFNACINVWADASVNVSPIRAEEVLQKLMDPEMQELLNVKPDSTSFATCLKAWATVSSKEPRAPEMAENLLSLMIRMYESGQLSGSPGMHAYATAMNIYGKSKHPRKVAKARRLLDEMISKREMFKNDNGDFVTAFTAIFNGAAHSPRGSVAMNQQTSDAFGTDDELEKEQDPYVIALETYYELRDDVHGLGVSPDHFVFANMLLVVRKHTDPDSIERRQLIEIVFRDACAMSSVSGLVVESLNLACPSQEMVNQLLMHHNASSIDSVNALPKEWTRSVPTRFRRIRRSPGREDKKQHQSNNAYKNNRYSRNRNKQT